LFIFVSADSVLMALVLQVLRCGAVGRGVDLKVRIKGQVWT